LYESYMKEVSILTVHITTGNCTGIIIYGIQFTQYYMPDYIEKIFSGGSNPLLSSTKQKIVNKK